MAGGLTDSQVSQEMEKMIAFIKQEALEKAREVKVKADEEFNIEKAKIVRQEGLAIDAFYQKKLKQIEVNQKIALSSHINRARLAVLDARENILTDLLSDASQQLRAFSTDTQRYQKLLHDLLLQAAYQLMEPKVVVLVRAQDVSVMTAVIDAVSKTYHAAMQQEVIFYIDKEEPLAADSAGGLVATSLDGRIRVDNTLENRLKIISEDMLPDIRVALFGLPTNRRFF